MLEVYERLGHHCHDHPMGTLILTHEQRDKGRLRAITAEGVEVRIFLDRGKPLQVGEFLRTACGRTLKIEGAVEPVMHASCDDWLTFSRACYHLGNRHVKIQVGERWLRILPDHVLEEMLNSLGLATVSELAIFVPESGAYSHGHHH